MPFKLTSFDERFSRFIFAWSEDRDTRRFLIEQCEKEIRHHEATCHMPSPPHYCGGKAAARKVREARFTLLNADTLFFLSFRILGLQKLWLELMGNRLAREAGLPVSGLDALRAIVSRDLKIDPVTAGRMKNADLHRTFSCELAGYWKDPGSD